MRLESVRSPDLVHRRRRDASPRRHRAFAPVGGVRRLVIERQVHDLLDFPRRQGLAPGRAGGVLQEQLGCARSCPYRQTRILTPIWESSDASGTLARSGSDRYAAVGAAGERWRATRFDTIPSQQENRRACKMIGPRGDVTNLAFSGTWPR